MERGPQITVTLAALTGIVAAAAAFIAPHEGLRTKPYVDAAGVLTTCYGHTATVIRGATYSESDCVLLLVADTIPHVIAVDKLTAGLEKSDEEWIALASFSFNLGSGALQRSTLLEKFRAGDRAGAMEEFKRWVHAGGRVLPGLVVRRAREARLFLSGAPA